MEEKDIPDTYQTILIQGVIQPWMLPCIEKMCNVRITCMRENKRARFAVEIYREDVATTKTEHVRFEYFETMEAATKFATNFGEWKEKKFPDVKFVSVLKARVCV